MMVYMRLDWKFQWKGWMWNIFHNSSFSGPVQKKILLHIFIKWLFTVWWSVSVYDRNRPKKWFLRSTRNPLFELEISCAVDEKLLPREAPRYPIGSTQTRRFSAHLLFTGTKGVPRGAFKAPPLDNSRCATSPTQIQWELGDFLWIYVSPIGWGGQLKKNLVKLF